MKTTLALTAFAALAIGVPSALAAPSSTAVDPYRPTGRLDVSKSLVRAGTTPILDWAIQYPKQVKDIVEIGQDDAITPKQRTLMEVRVVGAAFQVGSVHTPLALQSKLGAANWQTLFQGSDATVKPDKVVFSKVVAAGERIDFSARASNGRNR